MTVRPFLPYSDRRLHVPAQPVDAVTETVRMIWDDMVDTMDAMPGVGLAAPQIGVMLRLAVVDASDQRGQAVRMANPEVLHASVKMRASPRILSGSSLYSANLGRRAITRGTRSSIIGMFSSTSCVS